MEADFDARTERLQAALQEAADARSSVDALHAEVSKASGAAQAAQKVPISSSASLVTHPCSGLSGIKVPERLMHSQILQPNQLSEALHSLFAARCTLNFCSFCERLAC